ncbi:hypothetical protein Sjap_020649 [Stephania japonica]|uniref:PAS fold domain-containing protein n=1 Tax=Stephania japonica TaxID=461633 RepID=A0AAP0I0L3_9MAGN
MSESESERERESESVAKREEAYRVLACRFRELEASHERLAEQLRAVAEERRRKAPPPQEPPRRWRVQSDSSAAAEAAAAAAGEYSDPSLGRIPGFYSSGSPYKKLLKSIGNAVVVCRVSDWRIIYWARGGFFWVGAWGGSPSRPKPKHAPGNHSAEILHGWKEYEVLGKDYVDLFVEEHNHFLVEEIMKRLSTGQSWSGQFPLKKRSGEIFKGLVTESPLYEDGDLVGIVIVSSDAASFNIMNSNTKRTSGTGPCSSSRTTS